MINNMDQNKKDYVGFDYKQVIAESQKIGFMIDCYENFGWSLDECTSDIKDNGKSVLNMKRDRKIINKVELTRLQKHFEDCTTQIDRLESQKTQTATMVALAVGIIGTAFMAGSVFAVSHEPPIIWLCVLLAIPAFAGWIMPNFLFNNIKATKTKQIQPLIEEIKEEIYQICEKGHGLL